MTARFAIEKDALLLAEMNHQLIRDEGHRNPMSVAELAQRMAGWLRGEYRAVLFEHDGQIAGYALYRENDAEIYLRHFFIVRDQRRHGLGRQAFEILRSKTWPQAKRQMVEVLTANEGAIQFWRAVGFKEYALTLEITPSQVKDR